MSIVKTFYTIAIVLIVSLFPRFIYAQNACNTGYIPKPLSFFPGNTYSISQTDYCTSHVSTCDRQNQCQVRAYLSSNLVQVGTWVLAGVTGVKHARATLSNSFLLEGDPLDGTVIRANISGDASWKGRLIVGPSSGVHKSSASMVFKLFDESDGNRIVSEETLFSESCEVDTVFPSGCVRSYDDTKIYNLAVGLTRGHTYRIEFISRCRSEYDGAAVDIICDFENSSSRGMSRSDISVSIDRDYGEELDMLRMELDELRGQFDIHTHEYATGEGKGHNNVVIETSQPTKNE